jgi:hypothetical protein
LHGKEARAMRVHVSVEIVMQGDVTVKSIEEAVA